MSDIRFTKTADSAFSRATVLITGRTVAQIYRGVSVISQPLITSESQSVVVPLEESRSLRNNYVFVSQILKRFTIWRCCKTSTHPRRNAASVGSFDLAQCYKRQIQLNGIPDKCAIGSRSILPTLYPSDTVSYLPIRASRINSNSPGAISMSRPATAVSDTSGRGGTLQ